MKNKYLQFPFFSMAIVGLILSNNSATAQTDDNPLPSASEVIAKHIKAIGGADKLKAVKTRTIEGELEIPEANISGKIKVFQSAPNKLLMRATIAGIGEQSTGSDGETFWENSPMTGPEILEGARAHQLRMEAEINPLLVLDKMFDKVECTGKEEFNGEDCFVITASKEGQDAYVSYFSAKTGLYAGNKMSVATAMGNMEIVSVASEYKKVDGILISHKTTAKLPQQMTQIVTFKSIKINGKIKDGTFDLPEDIQDLKD